MQYEDDGIRKNAVIPAEGLEGLLHYRNNLTQLLADVSDEEVTRWYRALLMAIGGEEQLREPCGRKGQLSTIALFLLNTNQLAQYRREGKVLE